MIRHQSKSSPAPPFGHLSFGQGCALLTMYFQSLRRFRVWGLAIFRQLIPKPMSRDEMLDLARQLVKKAAEDTQ